MSTIALRSVPGRRWPAGLLPGLAIVAALVAGGFALGRVVPAASPLLWAMGLGVLVAPAARASSSTGAGVRFSATHLLRAGVALLGLRVSIGELAEVGIGGVAAATGTIVATLAGGVWLGRRLRVPDRLALLISTGSAICGASAIAAVNAVTGAGEEDVGYAVATVTVFGTAAMLAVPAASGALGLTDAQAGMWAGASVHEVAQATAAGAAVSASALKVATLVKLARVVLLAPVVALLARRSSSRTGATEAPPLAGRPAGARVPAFVSVFLALVAVRSVVPLPRELLDAATIVSTVLLTAGLAALGLGVRVAALRAAGMRPLALGVAAWAIAAASALGLVLIVG